MVVVSEDAACRTSCFGRQLAASGVGRACRDLELVQSLGTDRGHAGSTTTAKRLALGLTNGLVRVRQRTANGGGGGCHSSLCGRGPTLRKRGLGPADGETVQIGDVHIGTYASAATLQGWCRRVASLGNISDSDYEFTSPETVRFGGVIRQVSTWKQGFLELLGLFDSSELGLLKRIAAERSMPFISLDEDQFKAFKVQIGDVHINTHAGSATFQDWCRRVASLANISESDYGFVIPD